MGTIGKDFKYKVIKNFLTQDEIELLNLYCEMYFTTNLQNFDESAKTSNADTHVYADKIMESLLLKKQNIMEKETNKKLLPTYSFWRMYTKYSDLKKHKDRESCEISVTVNIGSDGTPWPIFIEGTSVQLKQGDAVIYLGCELTHWREPFLGDWCAQCFLHYVDANGKNKEWEKDKRPYWGVSQHGF